MEKSVAVSKELDVKVEIKEGKLFLTGDYEGKLGGAKLELHVGADQLIDAITSKIPGQADDRIGELLKAAFKKV